MNPLFSYKLIAGTLLTLTSSVTLKHSLFLKSFSAISNNLEAIPLFLYSSITQILQIITVPPHYTLTPRAVPLKTGEEKKTPTLCIRTLEPSVPTDNHTHIVLKGTHFSSNRGEFLQTPNRMFTDIKPRRGDRL